MAKESFIADDRGFLSRAELEAAWPAWDTWLTRNGISPGDCLVLPARTDLRTATALLALLQRRQSLLLWRQPLGFDGECIAEGTLPTFCTAALVNDGDPAAAKTAGPEGFRVVRAGKATPVNTRSYLYLQTSGTTGNAKLVAYEHETLWDNARNCIERLQMTSADRVIIPVPLAHMYGLGAAFLPAALSDASVRLVPDANLISFVRAEADFQPSMAFLTPSFCHLLVKGRKQARPYRLTVLAGDAADEQTLTAYEERHGCTVNLYGSTELGVIAAGSPADAFLDRRDSVGLPVPGVAVAPPESAPVLSDEPYPIRVRHPYGCAGYADERGMPVRPSLLYDDGWYITQDLGRLDTNGRLQLAGRFDDSVKRDGFLVAFADIERALQRLDAVERAVVVAGGLTPRGRELVAVCVTTPGLAPDAAGLRKAALQYLPTHAVPDRFQFVETLPLTATSKPDRRALAVMIA